MSSHLPLAVAVVIEHERRFLLIRRAKNPFAGWWSPVTGRVEPGESLTEAAVREAQEEMGLVVEMDTPFFVCLTADNTHELHFLRARWIGGTPTPDPQEVAEWGWFTLDEACALKRFFEADQIAFRKLAACF